MTHPLLIPRYILDQPIPFTKHEKGEIFTLSQDDITLEWYTTLNTTYEFTEDRFALYPCFRKLKWWQERKPEDMPLYMKYYNSVEERINVIKVGEWKPAYNGKVQYSDILKPGDWYIIEEIDEIATEEEFTAYLNSK